MATHPAAAKPPPAVPPLTGMVSNPPPQTAFSVVAPTGQLSPQAHHRMAAAPTQHPQYYHNIIHSHHTAAAPVHTAAVPVHVAAVQQPPPPTATQQYPHYKTHSAQPQAQGQSYGKGGHQQAFQSQYKAFESGQPVLNKQEILRSRDKEGLTSGMAGLKLEQGAPHYHSSVDMGKDGYRVELKPAANMVKFKFNTEAVLKASNIK